MAKGGLFAGLKKYFTPGTYQWKLWMKYLYGWGAAVVVFGALCKIEHWPIGSIMIIVGMATETFVFFVSAFEPVPHEYDWTLVYPELLGEEEGKTKKSKIKEIEEALEKSRITPEVFMNLEKGILSLKEQTEKMASISDAVLLTTDYAENVKKASSKVSELHSYYEKAVEIISPLSEIKAEDTEGISGELANFKENLQKVNSMYLSYLKISDEHMQVSSSLMQDIRTHAEKLKSLVSGIDGLSSNLSTMSTGIFEIINNLKGTTEKFTEVITGLSGNFSQLLPENDGKLTEIKNRLNELAQTLHNFNNMYTSYTTSIAQLNNSINNIKEGLAGISQLFSETTNVISSLNTHFANFLSRYAGLTDKISEETTQFSDNLKKLNKIYGGMLSAMSYRE